MNLILKNVYPEFERLDRMPNPRQKRFYSFCVDCKI